MTDVHIPPAPDGDSGQLTLPLGLLREFLAAAEASGLSPTEYLRYCLDRGRNLAKVLPPRHQASAMPEPDLLAGLAAALSDPQSSATFRRIQESPVPRVAVDPFEPTHAKRTHPNGLVEHGVLDPLGHFIPHSREAGQPRPPVLPG